MRAIKNFFDFWYNFIIGDDWVLAAGVVIGLAFAALTARHHNYWPLLPIVILVSLVISLRKAARP